MPLWHSGRCWLGLDNAGVQRAQAHDWATGAAHGSRELQWRTYGTRQSLACAHFAMGENVAQDLQILADRGRVASQMPLLSRILHGRRPRQVGQQSCDRGRPRCCVCCWAITVGCRAEGFFGGNASGNLSRAEKRRFRVLVSNNRARKAWKCTWRHL